MTQADPIQRSEIGPPHEDPLASRTDLAAIEPLMLSGVHIHRAEEGASGEIVGSATFADRGLVGPPGRLQGGLHPYARLLAPFRRLTGIRQTGPLAMALRLGAPITLGADLHFRGRWLRSGSGHWLSTRFSDTDRLDGLLTTVRWYDTSLPADCAPAVERMFVAPTTTRRILSLQHVARDGWFGVRIQPKIAWRRLPGMRRFATSSHTIGAAFVGFYLDTTAILSQAMQLRNPLFTTRFAIEMAGDRFDAGEAWLFVAHTVPVHWPDLGVPLPACIRGRPERTRTVQAWMIRERDWTVQARAWITGHPVDLERLMRLRARDVRRPAGDRTP